MELIIVLFPVLLHITSHSCRTLSEIETGVKNIDSIESNTTELLAVSDENEENRTDSYKYHDINQILKLLPFEPNRRLKKKGQQYINLELLQNGNKDIPIAIIVASPNLKEYYNANIKKNSVTGDSINKSKENFDIPSDDHEAVNYKHNKESRTENDIKSTIGLTEKTSTWEDSTLSNQHELVQKNKKKSDIESSLKLLSRINESILNNIDVKNNYPTDIKADDYQDNGKVNQDRSSHSKGIPETLSNDGITKSEISNEVRVNKVSKIDHNDYDQNNIQNTSRNGVSEVANNIENGTVTAFTKPLIEKGPNTMKNVTANYIAHPKNNLSTYIDITNTVLNETDEKADLKDNVDQTIILYDDYKYLIEKSKLANEEIPTELHDRSINVETRDVPALLLPGRKHEDTNSSMFRLPHKTYNLSFVFNK